MQSPAEFLTFYKEREVECMREIEKWKNKKLQKKDRW